MAVVEAEVEAVAVAEASEASEASVAVVEYQAFVVPVVSVVPVPVVAEVAVGVVSLEFGVEADIEVFEGTFHLLDIILLVLVFLLLDIIILVLGIILLVLAFLLLGIIHRLRLGIILLELPTVFVRRVVFVPRQDSPILSKFLRIAAYTACTRVRSLFI